MLSTDEVKRIALLARIGLTDAEIERYRKDLSSVLDFFRELEALDLSDGADGEGVPVKENDTREDRAEPFGSVGRDDIMKSVPSVKDGYVKVRSVF
ncbi:MAG: Asp-tRNA(Asn)/Glu-tRNA(Gln) amidotransferase subunit GatC [Candidatus Moranbacteria bacterium]|nr:Asp-tRNA(Asn)/Glu-tRNA(Gln) amidotransferase subunit GatC [Candidatus Moranbacteria bacterium]